MGSRYSSPESLFLSLCLRFRPARFILVGFGYFVTAPHFAFPCPDLLHSPAVAESWTNILFLSDRPTKAYSLDRLPSTVGERACQRRVTYGADQLSNRLTHNTGQLTDSCT